MCRNHVDTVREQLKAPWSRIAGVQRRKDRELVEVYLWREGDRTGGLAVVVAEPEELTIVNIVGRLISPSLRRSGASSGFRRTSVSPYRG